MKRILRTVLLTGLMTTLSCKNDKTSNDINSSDSLSPETEIADIEVEQGLVINSKTLKDVETEFKVDFYEASRKYGGKEVTVSVGFEPSQPYSDQKAIFYGDSENFHGFPIVKSGVFRIALDGDSKEVRQTYVQLAQGDISPIYGSDQLGSNDKMYLIYDKKLDVVLTGYNHVVNLIAGYIRMKNNGALQENIDDLYDRINQEDPTLLEDLKQGNLYYAEYKIEGKIDSSTYLLPCEYTFKGTISKDIQERTSSYGVSKVDLILVGSKQLSKKWLINKDKVFTKQIK